jgi:diguanylate cyclase (GGDEF)-like protein
MEESSEHNRILFRITLIPIIVNLILASIGNDLSIRIILLSIVYIFSFYGAYRILTEYKNELKAKILLQQRQCEESQKINQELQKTQAKAKDVYDKMLSQKHELEQTNKTLNRISAEMYILNELLKYISSTLEINELLDLVIDSIIGAIGVDTCYVIIKSNESSDYHCRSKSNYNIDVETDLLRSFQNGELQKYFDSKKSFADDKVELNEYSFIKDRPAGSLIITPLISKDEVYGLLFAEHASVGVLSESNLQFFEGIASQINIAVNNASLYSTMHEMAIMDGLTQIYNRGYFQSKLYDHFDEVTQEDKPISVVLFDLDKFKRINDTYGHLFGDKALKMVSKIAKEFANHNGGFAGRYGGEEFVMAFPHKDMTQTYEIVKGMHEAIKKEELIYEDDTVVNVNISIGITCYPEFGTSAEDLLNRADNAMYFSKRNGRGRITMDSKAIEGE